MNKKNIRSCAIVLLFAVSTYAQDQEPKQLDEVVVSDSKFALSKEKSGKIIVKITANDLKSRQGQSVATVLSSVAGVEINGNQSRTGKDLGLFVRGGKSNQVLILIDGIPVSDASGIDLSYDLRLLPIDQIESIEVMKGASSTLYGSGAATGVINVVLKKGSKKVIAGNVYLNMGSQSVAKSKKYNPQDYNQGFSVNGNTSKLNYYVSLNSTETKGISEAKSEDENKSFEEDRFSRVNALTKVGFTPTKNMVLDFFANYDKIKNDFDGGAFLDEKVNQSISEQYRFGFLPKYKYKKGELVLNSGITTIERKYTMFSDWKNAIENSSYKSRNVNVDVFNKYAFSPQFFVVLGNQFQFFEMDNDVSGGVITKEIAKFNTVDPYLACVFNSEFGLNLNVGARYNMHSVYGTHFVCNINPSYSFSELPLKIVTSYSTAFVTPSLYQLYSPYGNLDLTPADNSTLEAGFEFDLLDKKITFNTVAFYREEKNAIGFFTNQTTFESNYINIEGKHNAKGIETMFSCVATQKLKIKGNYTFTQVEEPLNRLIPKHKANVVVEYQPTTRAFVNVSYQYVDGRKDAFFDSVTYATVNAYQLVNTTIKYDLIPNRMSFFGAVDNILDVDFIENIGYTTRGRNFKLGLNLSF